ncbi:MAG: serine/threonine-protein kinase [Gemmatimonadaceae bacterium]
MSRRRQPNTKHGRKRPVSIAPPDEQTVGQDDAAAPGGVAPLSEGSVVGTVTRLSGDVLGSGEDANSARPSPASGTPDAAAPAEQRPKTPPPIDPDAPTSVLPASELPGTSGARPRISPADATGYFARQPTPQPGESIAVPKICPHCASEYETDARFCPKDGTALRPKGGSDALIGRVIADRYHVLKVVGEGGMGRIYLAEHVRMNRQCALKVMRPSLVHDADSAARFGREASNAARIIHPNVAAVFDYGETEGLVYLVMEYVEGEPLGGILQTSGALAPPRALEITKQVTDALTAAHELGIVHRDLKPDNIIITKSKSGREVAKVVDFGIAKAIAESPDRRLTETGLVIGTPEFMSPEQLVGDPADARSDIYSLGCILYLMLVGSPAADAPTRDAMLKRRLNELPPHPSHAKHDLPPELDAIVVKMLAISPADRYQSAAELRAALDQVRLGPDVDGSITTSGAMPVPRISLDPSKAPTLELPPVAPISLPPWAPSWMRRPTVQRAARTALAVAGVALVGGAAVGAALSVAMRGDRGTPPTTAGAGARGDSVALSGVRPAGAGATTAANPTLPKTATGGGPLGTGSTRPSTTTRSATPTTPRGSTTVANRTRADSLGVRLPLTRRPAEVDSFIIPPPIRRFRAAVLTGDVERIKQAYPGLTDNQRRVWQAQFSLHKPERAMISRVRGISGPDANGNAVVEFVMAVSFSDRTSGTPVAGRPTHYRATIRREGPNLVLQSLAEVTRR